MTLLLAEALLGIHHIEMQLHGKDLVVSLLHTKGDAKLIHQETQLPQHLFLFSKEPEKASIVEQEMM